MVSSLSGDSLVVAAAVVLLLRLMLLDRVVVVAVLLPSLLADGADLLFATVT